MSRKKYVPRIDYVPPQTFKGWVNWYQNELGQVFGTGIQEDIKTCEKSKQMIKADGKTRWIACTYIEIKEQRQ
jgi:hypothetical protein